MSAHLDERAGTVGDELPDHRNCVDDLVATGSHLEAIVHKHRPVEGSAACDGNANNTGKETNKCC